MSVAQPSIDVKGSPFHMAAMDYYRAGYSPLPVNGKTLLVSGVSGRYPYATRAQIADFAREHPNANLALRLPDDMLALDIDAYNGDLERLRKLERELGPLPVTWNADARGGDGGKLFFRVPPGIKWVSDIDRIKVIQATHRYVIVAPSVHPETHTRYEWYRGLSGKRHPEYFPEPDECEDLPREWRQKLRRGPKPPLLASGEHPNIPSAQIGSEVKRLPNDKPCADVAKYVHTMRRKFDQCIAAQDGLNDAGWLAVSGLFLAAYKGHQGLRTALRELGEVYRAGYRRAGTRPRAEQWLDMIGRKLAEGVDFPEDDPCDIEEETNSWEFVKWDDVLTGEGTVDPSILPRTDGKCLFYVGKTHVVHGASESGKSWFVLHACAALIRRQHHVVFVDFEDSARPVFDRLRSVGLSKTAITRFFHYIDPAEKLPSEPDFYLDLISDVNPALVVLDGVTEAMELENLDPLGGTDIVKWQRRMMRSLTKAGLTVVAIDHEPHRVPGAPRPIGGVHKKAGVDVMYGIKNVEPGGVGHTLVSMVIVTKDRPGRVEWVTNTFNGRRDRHAGNFIMSSDKETGDVICKIEPPRDDDGSESRALPQHQQIRSVIDSLPAGTEFVSHDIGERLPDISNDSIRKSLSRLVDDGAIKRIAQGKYRTPENVT